MKNVKDRFIQVAIEEAKKSDHSRYKVGAVIFDKKHLISKGHNYTQRSAKHLHPKFQKWPGSVHAEVDTILKAKTELRGLSIFVVRIGSDDKFRNSRPCKYCRIYLRHVGLKHIYYSIDHYPYIEELKISD